MKRETAVDEMTSDDLFAFLAETDRLRESGDGTTMILEKLLLLVNSLSSEWSVELSQQPGEPIERGQRVLGFLSVQGAMPHFAKLLLKRELADLLERQELERRQVDKLQRLSRAGRMVSSSFDLQSTLEAILEMALEVTGARYGIFRLLDREGEKLVTAAVAGENLEAPLVEALALVDDHITGQVARSKASLRIGDLRQPPWDTKYVRLDQELEMRSELAVPLLGHSRRLEGVLNLESPQQQAFTAEDQLLLETFAGQAVVAIQQARLLDALQEIASGVLEWPCEEALMRVTFLTTILLNAQGAELECSAGLLRQGTPTEEHVRVDLEPGGHLLAYVDEPTDWAKKVLKCLAHHATLALKNERRLELLKSTQQRQALTETFAAVGDLSANLLHQLNNKVGIIPVRIEGIQDKCAELVEQSPYLKRNLEEIGNGAQKALEIVRQNLGILKPRAQGLVNLNQCLKRAVKELGLEDLVEGSLQLPSVQGDVRSLTLVFLNLLENAARAMNHQGTIRVTGQALKRTLKVEVSDDGPGIPESQHQEIFQLTSDRARPHNLGFGLWWVRTVMERMSGSVSVRSDGRSGTTFILEFLKSS